MAGYAEEIDKTVRAAQEAGALPKEGKRLLIPTLCGSCRRGGAQAIECVIREREIEFWMYCPRCGKREQLVLSLEPH